MDSRTTWSPRSRAPQRPTSRFFNSRFSPRSDSRFSNSRFSPRQTSRFSNSRFSPRQSSRFSDSRISPRANSRFSPRSNSRNFSRPFSRPQSAKDYRGNSPRSPRGTTPPLRAQRPFSPRSFAPLRGTSFPSPRPFHHRSSPIRQVSSMDSDSNWHRSIRCYNCNQLGHIQRFCPHRPSYQSGRKPYYSSRTPFRPSSTTPSPTQSPRTTRPASRSDTRATSRPASRSPQSKQRSPRSPTKSVSYHPNVRLIRTGSHDSSLSLNTDYETTEDPYDSQGSQSAHLPQSTSSSVRAAKA